MSKKTKKNLLKNSTSSKKQNILIALSFVLTVVLAVLSGVYFTFGARAAGYSSLSDRAVPTKYIHNFGVKLNDDVTIEQLSTAIALKDENYGGYISQHSIAMTSVLPDGKKKSIDSYALFFNDKLKRQSDYFIRTPKVSVPDGYYSAYYTGWEWSDKDIGKHCKVTVPKANGENTEINVVITGTVSADALTLGILSGRPYVYANRSLLAIENFDVELLYPNAEREVYVVSDISNPLKFLSDNSLGRIYAPPVEIAADQLKVDGAIYENYMYFVALILCIALLSITGGLLRTWHYIIYGGLTAITMLVVYFTKIKNTVGIYAYQNVVTSWFAGLMAAAIVLALLAAIFAQLVYIRNYHKNTNSEGNEKNDKTAKYI